MYDRASNIRPSTILDLAYSAGRLVGHYRLQNVTRIKPSQWKGQRPKDVDNPYTLSLLTPEEREVVNRCGVPPSLLNNVLDAVGLGLWHVGRR